MEIKILTLIVLLVILLYAVRGYRLGFLRTLTTMVFLALSLMLVYFLAPYVRDFVKESTPVYTRIREACTSVIGSGSADITNADAQAHYITMLHLPEPVEQFLIKNNTAENYAAMAVGSFREYLITFLSDSILTIFVYLVTFLLVRLLLHVAAAALDILSHLPVLRGINRLFGLLLGAGQGLVIVWIAFLVLTLCSGIAWGRDLLNTIYNGRVLGYLYDANVFLKILFR